MKNSKQFQQLKATSSYVEVYQVVEKMFEIKEARGFFKKTLVVLSLVWS